MEYRILLGLPHNGSLKTGTAIGCLRATDKHYVELLPRGSSDLAGVFNRILCEAQNRAMEGECTHLAFCHADIAPDDFWIDRLIEAMDEKDADFVSAISPIKDKRGLTSTGLGFVQPDGTHFSWAPLRRFTMTEIAKFPVTFDAADTGNPDRVLLHNSGCWIADLRKPVFSEVDENGMAKVYFDFPQGRWFTDGRWVTKSESEDWFFSRRLYDVGAKTYVTKKATLGHIGDHTFRNDHVWGDCTVDNDSEPIFLQADRDKYIHPNGYWLQDIPEWDAFDEGLAKAIWRLLDDDCAMDVTDIGCGRGDYVFHWRAKGIDAKGVDGRPVNCPGPVMLTDLAEEVIEWDSDWTVCLEVGEHIPREKESNLLDNVARCRQGAIVSWAQPGQPGRGHINCRTPEEVVKLLEEYGLQWSPGESERLREAATLPWFKKNLLVFRRER